MAKYRIDSIAALARQMEFTPADTRGTQVSAAEELLHAIDPARAYPLDFVVFRITGYHPKNDVAQDLLTGLALQHDLGLLIEKVSNSLDVRTTDIAEPVLAIEDVTTRFDVASKTIQRWRRRGLPARRFLFPDGKRRVGFLLSSVERFLATHQDQVDRGTRFSQVDDAERDEIIRRARRLARFCQCCMHDISRRLARKLNRSPLTVLHTIKKHDQENPDQAVFPMAATAISDEDRARIAKAYRRGVGVKALAKRVCRPRSAVYRVVLEERIQRLNKRKAKFIDDALYHQPDAEAVIEALVRQDALPEPRRPEDARVPRDLPPHLAALYREPLLTPARERALFLKFNFHKMQFVTLRRELDPELARNRDLHRMELAWRRAVETKNQIIRANLRLVASVARKHLRPNLSLAELMSEGTLTLMRAVDGFDVHRGHKFSTYATLALMKGFARSVPQMTARRATSAAEETLANLPDRQGASAPDLFIERDALRDLLDTRLNDRERRVVLGHYGLGPDAAPATYEQLGRTMGLTKERVRQIELIALEKLRTAAGPR